MKSKKANLLTENVVFIIITILFISMLFVFVTRASSKTILVEEAYAKKIALIVDSAKAETNLLLNINKLLEERVDIGEEDVVRIVDNKVFVQLSSSSGYGYGVFNDVNVDLSLEEREEGSFLNIRVTDKEGEDAIAE